MVVGLELINPEGYSVLISSLGFVLITGLVLLTLGLVTLTLGLVDSIIDD